MQIKQDIEFPSMEDKDADKDCVAISREFSRILHGHNSNRYLGKHFCCALKSEVMLSLTTGKKQTWSGFHKRKKVILNQNVFVQKRLIFVDGCITPTMLFSLSVLPLGQVKIKALDVLHRKMLQRIVGWRRIPEEGWENIMRRMNVRLELRTRIIL